MVTLQIVTSLRFGELAVNSNCPNFKSLRFEELAVNSNSLILVLLNFRELALILCKQNVF